MSFLAPWLLLLGGAAIVPLLIHLLRRRIGLRVDFPAARYLARAEQEHSRTMRMRNLLLMILRVLAVLLIAVAAARPVARLGGGGHAPTALAIVVDNSMSSAVVEGTAPLIERFKRMALELLADASGEDRLWLITADGLVRGGTAATLRDEVERIRSLAGAGDPRAAVAAAVAAVERSGMPARQVVVLTDGQRSAWREAARSRASVPVLAYAPSLAAPANRAVTSAEPRPVRWTPRGAVAIGVLGTDSTTYRMALGERTVARGTVAPNEEATIRAAPAERGWTSGLVEIEPDELPADNVRHFALWIGAPPAVRVTPGAGEFVRNALDVLRSAQRVTDGADVTIAPADEAQRRPAFLMPPADPVRVGAANRSLERLGIPWRFGPVRRGAAMARGADLPGVQISYRHQLVPRGVPDGDTLAVAGEEPWIVSGAGYVLIGSPLVPEATSLPISAPFIPWLTDILTSRLHTEPGRVWHATPGARIARPSGADALEGATGGRAAISGATIDAPAAPGTYFLVQGTRRVGALVVNAEIEESRLERWSASELERRIASGGTRVVTDPAQWARLAFQGASRRSLVIPLLLVVVLILGLESLAAGGRAPRHA